MGAGDQSVSLSKSTPRTAHTELVKLADVRKNVNCG